LASAIFSVAGGLFADLVARAAPNPAAPTKRVKPKTAGVEVIQDLFWFILYLLVDQYQLAGLDRLTPRDLLPYLRRYSVWSVSPY
jgi:hypothetical protein